MPDMTTEQMVDRLKNHYILSDRQFDAIADRLTKLSEAAKVSVPRELIEAVKAIEYWRTGPFEECRSLDSMLDDLSAALAAYERGKETT